MKCKLAASLAVLALLVIAAAPAYAHVVVEPSTATPGAEQTFVFRVANEEDTTTTTKLEVKFPTDHPIVGVAVEPIPGWTIAVTKIKLAKPIETDDGPVSQVVSQITWSGGTISKGQFQRFPWVGTLPDTPGVIVLPAIQTYANGDEVSWIQPIVAGQPEPERPTPIITVSAAKTGGNAAAPTTAPAPATTGSTASSSSVSTAKTLGIVGLVAGLLGLVLGGVALSRVSRPKP